MIPLKDKVNVNAPVGTYPFGAEPFGTLRDNPGDNSGTPVDVVLVQDIMIFAEALMAAAQVTPNGVLDVGGSPQLLIALATFCRGLSASEAAKGTAEIATQTEVDTGVDDSRFVTPLKLNQTPTLMRVIGSAKLIMKVVDIGEWRMHTAGEETKSVLHGLPDFTKIKTYSAMINNDLGTVYSPLTVVDSNTVPQGGYGSVTSTTILLNRLTGGFFDGSTYNTAGISRGCITIIYED